MPELPEVETIKTQLAPAMPCQVTSVTYSEVSGSIVKNKDFSPKGKRLESIRRQGKVLIFHFEEDRYLVSGLGMTGSWRISPKKILEKHTHVQFKTQNDRGEICYLAYVDPRRFGNLHFFKKPGLENWLKRLGADVSSEDFNEDYLLKRFERFPNKVIKSFLLEQNHFAGVGNYMASEICAHARIRPSRVVQSLTKKDAKNIIKATKTVLDQAIKTKGTTFAGGYSDAYGDVGEGVKNLVVFYQEICRMCNKTKVIKTTLAGRGTYHCLRCQR
jgi:formamidopyrimidine-DNA glycosylase